MLLLKLDERNGESVEFWIPADDGLQHNIVGHAGFKQAENILVGDRTCKCMAAHQQGQSDAPGNVIFPCTRPLRIVTP